MNSENQWNIQVNIISCLIKTNVLRSLDSVHTWWHRNNTKKKKLKYILFLTKLVKTMEENAWASLGFDFGLFGSFACFIFITMISFVFMFIQRSASPTLLILLLFVTTILFGWCMKYEGPYLSNFFEWRSIKCMNKCSHCCFTIVLRLPKKILFTFRRILRSTITLIEPLAGTGYGNVWERESGDWSAHVEQKNGKMLLLYNTLLSLVW